MEGTHDDNADTWLQLAAATANVVRWLVKEEQINGEAEERRKTKEADDEQASSKLPIVRI